MARLTLMAAIALLLSACASYVATSGRVVVTDENHKASVVITDADRREIEGYYSRQKRSGASAAHDRNSGGVPSGVVRHAQLPATVRGEALPGELERRLSPLPSTYARIRVGRDIVLIERRSRVVVDIAYGLAS